VAKISLPADALTPGRMALLAVDGAEFVVWRGSDGEVRSAPRRCPHLDHDLADGWFEGNDLVCAGHGWGFDGCGQAFKRNELGRVDPKGDVARLVLHEHDGVVDVEGRA
jgi:5,5'-dehydrodivanillate O-demethylase